ncbi:TAXI family TRAP transporter solute-binding subunit [Peptococcaceae bacterium 1198_IL3148]
MFRFKKRGMLLLMAVAMLAVLITGCGSSDSENAAADKKFINIATGGTAGVYYPLGGAIAGVLNENISGVSATAQSTGASVANVNMLNDGSVQMAFVQNDIAYYAVNGTEMFADNKVADLQAIATIYPETVQIVTLKSTGINSIEDLKGKKVAVGAAGSSVVSNSEQVLGAYGMSFDDIDEQFLSFSEAANGLKDGNIDAAFLSAGFPTSAIQDIAAQHDIVMLSLDEDKVAKLQENYSYYTPMTIPAGTYPGQTEDVNAVSIMAMLVVKADMAEQDAYDITKAIFDNIDKVKAAHSVGQYISKESAKEGISIPMHPGAEKYFNE